MRLTYDEIESNMKNAFYEKNGSIAEKNSFEEKVIEALSSELYGLSCYGDYIMKQAFVQTATGAYLDKLGAMRDCERKSASNSTGRLRFYNSEAATEDIRISAGTICCAAGKPYIQFETTEDAVISAGKNSVETAARALNCSEEYNVKAGEITVMVNAPVKVENVINDADFIGGCDIETDSAYRERIIRNYTIPANGMGRRSIENKICKLDYISDCKILNAETAGTVHIIVVVRDGESLTAERTFEIRDCLGFGDMTGVLTDIAHSNVVLLDVSADVCLAANADEGEMTAYVKGIINEVLSERKIGRSVSVSKITKELLKNDSIEDVNIYCDKMVNGTFVCPENAYLKLSTLKVSCYYE